MTRAICIFVLAFVFFEVPSEAETTNQPYLVINLFSADRSGLASDRRILQSALEELGCCVHWFNSDLDCQASPADINIFCEKLIPNCFEKAHYNWFIPNPEWIWDSLELFYYVDLVLCRTREVERIFNSLNMPTFYLGFTSPDHIDSGILKNYHSFFHLAGSSWQKGTLPIFRAWENHSEFPLLTAIRFSAPPHTPPKNMNWIRNWIPEQELLCLQNSCGIHICLSETEGFGHSIMESMSVGAVVITTDAPPMNEFIRDARCLVPYEITGKQNLATTYHVKAKEVEKKIKELLKLSEKELSAIGQRNRELYLEYRSNFHERLTWLLGK